MATFSGSDGVILVGSNQVAEVRSYSIDESMDTLEDTSMGDSARTYKTSLNRLAVQRMFSLMILTHLVKAV